MARQLRSELKQAGLSEMKKEICRLFFAASSRPDRGWFVNVGVWLCGGVYSNTLECVSKYLCKVCARVSLHASAYVLVRVQLSGK